MKLYDYAHSMAAFRTRMALSLKRIEYQSISVDITAGEQFTPEFLALNPIAEVPCLVDGTTVLTQSMAISEYLDERYPEPPFLPDTPEGRARVREISQLIACDIQPLHPGRVRKYLTSELGASEEQQKTWCVHWVSKGISALEETIKSDPKTGKFCYGDSPTLADILLVSEVYVAVNRFDLDLKASHPVVWGIYETCMAMREFNDVAPHNVAKAA